MLEIEMKFRVADFAAVERRLAEWGAAVAVEREDADHYFNAPHRDFGKTDEALKALRAAADRERALRYNEPPTYPRPVLEVLGWAAARAGRDDVAEQAFREALAQYPASAGALAGLKSLGKPIQSGF